MVDLSPPSHKAAPKIREKRHPPGRVGGTRRLPARMLTACNDDGAITVQACSAVAYQFGSRFSLMQKRQTKGGAPLTETQYIDAIEDACEFET